MTAEKRKIKASIFVHDLKQGMGEEDLIRKYDLSREQLYGVFRKLVDAGAMDAMELYMRTSLSDTGVIEFVAETVSAGQEGDRTVRSGKAETPRPETQKQELWHM